MAMQSSFSFLGEEIYSPESQNKFNAGYSKEGKKTWLSHSGMEGLERCPRCFWLQYKRGVYQPEGIVSRLANRFDGVIKNYFDKYRSQGILPPMVAGKMEGKLQNPFKEIYFLADDKKYGNYGLKGKLDECLVRDDGAHTPVDHKTSSSDPREKDIFPAYRAQLDTYALLLEANRKPTAGIGHLIFFYPDFSEELHNGFPMVVHIQTLETDPLRAEERMIKAIGVLESSMPAPSPECPFCAWRERVNREVR